MAIIARSVSRGQFLAMTAAAALATGVPAARAATVSTKPIPKSKNGEQLPVIGIGTNRYGRPAANADETARRTAVMKALLDGGGKVVDTAEGYGESEAVLGEIFANMGARQKAFFATKLGKEGRDAGIATMEASFKRLRTDVIDLMMVHNLRDTATQLPIMQEWKQAGRFRYVGVSHSNPDAQEALGDVMTKEEIDFVQLNYSIDVRGPEKRLLPMAKERGIAVMVNLPLGRAKLIERVAGTPFPAWAKEELGCSDYSQLLLKWVVSHPSVNVAIPGTTSPDHMADNLIGGHGPLATAAQRDKIAAIWA